MHRDLDLLPSLEPDDIGAALPAARLEIAKLCKQIRKQSQGALDPVFELFNDNRYEQHHYLWKSDLEHFDD